MCTVQKKTQVLRFSGGVPVFFVIGHAKPLLAFACWILHNHDVYTGNVRNITVLLNIVIQLTGHY